MKHLLPVVLSLITLSTTSCDEGWNKPNTTAYLLEIPPGFPPPDIAGDNPLTVEGILLGRQLFYDPTLSGDSTQSCASCHVSAFGFTDSAKAFSTGIHGLPGGRNSMALHNLAWDAVFFWNGRAASLREQSLIPIQDALEMDASLAAVIERLKASDRYRKGFREAFGRNKIDEEHLGMAMEQFMHTIISGNSKFDQVIAGMASFTAPEQRGILLFNGEVNPNSPNSGADCFHCHGGVLATNHKLMNNGLDSVLTDLGLGDFTGKASDNGKFKVPSLRNLAFTAPYMHDGRFNTLMEVLNFYNENVHSNSPNIDPGMGNFANGLGLNLQDKMDIIAFLNTLNDPSISTDTLFQNPYQ